MPSVQANPGAQAQLPEITPASPRREGTPQAVPGGAQAGPSSSASQALSPRAQQPAAGSVAVDMAGAGAPAGLPALPPRPKLSETVKQFNLDGDAAAGFQALRNRAPDGNERAQAVAFQALSTGLTAAATFGAGRPAGNPGTYDTWRRPAAQTPPPPMGAGGPLAPESGPGVGTALGQAVANVLGSTASGVPGNLLAGLIVAPMLSKLPRFEKVPPGLLVPNPSNDPTLADLQQKIAARQAALANLGSAQNAAIGAALFAVAVAVRVAVENKLPADTPGMKVAATAAVSLSAGAAFGAVMGTRMAIATKPVPDFGREGGAKVKVPLFHTVPVTQNLANPPYRGSPTQFAGSVAARAGALALAGAVLELSKVGNAAATPNTAESASLQAAEMFVAAAAYFALSGRIAGVEGARAAARRAPANDAQAPVQPGGAVAPNPAQVQLAALPQGQPQPASP